MAIFEAGATFSKAHHFGALQPLVFWGVVGLKDGIDIYWYFQIRPLDVGARYVTSRGYSVRWLLISSESIGKAQNT